MISSLTQCNRYIIIIYQFRLLKFKRGEIFMIPLLTYCNSDINHSLVTDGINHAGEDTSTRTGRLYI